MHVSELARLFACPGRRFRRRSTSSTSQDSSLTSEPPCPYVTGSEAGRRRPVITRRFTADFKARIEQELTDPERGAILILLHRVDRSLQPPRERGWWLAR